MFLLKFHNYKTARRIKLENGVVQFSDEEEYNGSATKKNGLYEILEGTLIALFSSNNSNYLYLENHLYELTPDITVECHIAQSRDDESRLKVYNKEILIFDLTYVNHHAPFVLPDPFYPDEDYETSNFASKIMEYVKKVQEDPAVVLFP